MTWPSPQDYNEAIQNPKIAFADPELQAGHPELTKLGLPRPITGGFASVYKMQCPQRTWAVRCFLRQFHDHEQRYAAISDHLAQARLSYTVGFTFLREGVLVRGKWYPILKMEWIHGEPLNAFIEKNLGKPDDLISLAKKWVEMTKALQKASVAHGDLQHGNVFVVNGQLRLIDYDGMYVPALYGQGNHEVGHRNYQHPLRTEADFGPYLDNFSTWVIYVSLIALAVDPRLWKRFGAGDESLLLRRKDFDQPDASDTLHALEEHPDAGIRSAATIFRSLLNRAPRNLPSLDGKMAAPEYTIIICEGCGQNLRVPIRRGSGRISCPKCGSKKDWIPQRSNVPEWINDYIRNDDGTKVEPVPCETDNPAIDGFNATWIIDYLGTQGPPEPPVTFINSVTAERYLLGVSTIVSLLLMGVTQATAMSTIITGLAILFTTLANVAFWVHRYRLEPGLADSITLKSNSTMFGEKIGSTTRNIESMAREKVKLREQNSTNELRIKKEKKTTEEKEKKEVETCGAINVSVVSSINTRRRNLNQQEAEGLRKIQNGIGTKITDLSGQIAALTQAESNEIKNKLQVQQEQHIVTHLRYNTLDRASIPGIGSTFKSRLKAANFQTAADIDLYQVQRVDGIGWTRAQSLADWRKSIEARARTTMPSALSQGDAGAIKMKYESQRQALEGQRQRAQQQKRTEEDALRVQYPPLFEQLDKEEHTASAKYQTEIDEIQARYTQQYRVFQESISRLAADIEPKINEIDANIAIVNKDLFKLQWENAKLIRRLKSYEEIRFRKYMKRVFLGS